MSEAANRNLINVIIFTVGWWAAVMGAAWGIPWLGPVVIIQLVVVHVIVAGITPGELLFVGACMALGFLIDSGLASAGVYSFHGSGVATYVAPVWLVFMWANLGITVKHSLSWLQGKTIPGILTGAVTGPVAYYGGAGLGALHMGPNDVYNIAAMAVVYGVFVAGLFKLSLLFGNPTAKRAAA